MIYLRRDNRERSERRPLYIGIVIFTVLLLFSVFSIKPPAPSRSLVYFIGRPVWALQRFMSSVTGDAFTVLRTKSALVRENKELRGEVQELESAMLDVDRIRSDLKKYERMLGRNSPAAFVAANVLAKPSTMPYDTFILDVGEEGGIAVGDTIVVGNDTAVGKIIDVRGSISKAQLLSSAGVTTPVLVGEKALSFDAHGYGGGNIVITVPRDLALAVGEAVYIGTNPRMFLGEVDVVSVSPSDAMKLVGIRLPVNIFEISQVKILHSQPVGDTLFSKEPDRL